MKLHWLIIYNFLLLPFLCFLLTGLQTSLWLNLVGWFPAPQLWLIVLTFVVIHRPLWISIAFGYLISVMLSGFTAWPFEKMLLSVMCVVGVSYLVKDRLFGSGPNYFSALVGLNALLFQMIYVVVGYALEGADLARFNPFDGILSPLLSVLFAYPIYRLLRLLDRLTNQEQDMEPGRHLL